MMAENQNKLVEGMNRLMTRLENPILPNPILPKAQDARSTRQNPPHLSNTQRQLHTQATYEPSSPSEGAYARELNRQMIGLKEPRIRDNLRFTANQELYVNSCWTSTIPLNNFPNGSIIDYNS